MLEIQRFDSQKNKKLRKRRQQYQSKEDEMCVRCLLLSIYLLLKIFAKAQRIAEEKSESCITFSFVEFIDISRIIWIGIFSLFIYMRVKVKWVNVCGGFCGWGKMQKRQFLLINLSKECICGFFFPLSCLLFSLSTCFYSLSINFILMACKGYCSRKDIPIDLRSHKFWSLFRTSFLNI